MSKSNLKRRREADEQNNLASKVQANSRLTVLKKHWWVVGLIALLSLGALGAGLKYLEDDARRQAANGSLKGEQSLLNSINPFLTTPTPAPTPQLSKEYIYAGGRLLAVEDANANAAPPADLAVWRRDATAGTGTWHVMGGQGSQQTSLQWGANTDDPAPGDFDGDGKTDFSVFRPSDGFWYIQKSSDLQLFAYQFGMSGDQIAQADYDGDGRTDAAVYRPSTGYWYILRSSDGTLMAQQWGVGATVYKITPADFDGDGKADIAVWYDTDSKFLILRSSDSQTQTIDIGQTGDTPVVGDYDGDGRADAAVWRYGIWMVLYSSTNTSQTFTFGDPATDKAVQNDYDGDGKVDVAIWRPSNGTWYILQSSKVGQPGYQRETQWGMAGDIPVPAFYRR